MKTALAAVLAFCAVVSTAGAARADQRIYAYEPADPATRKALDTGLTIVFDKGLVGMRVREVLATAAKASVHVKPVGDKELGAKLETLLPRDAFSRELYRIEDEAEGPAMVRALCPGAAKGWLVFSPLRALDDLTLQVLGADPASGKAKVCATLHLKFRGEWRVPQTGPAQPTLTPYVAPSRPQ
jgi:hypothetical protein